MLLSKSEQFYGLGAALTVFHKHSYVGFYNNSANQYGRVKYCELLQNSKSKISFDTTEIKFEI